MGLINSMSQFKYLGCVLDESGTDVSECSWKVASAKRIAGAIRSLVNYRDLLHESTRVCEGEYMGRCPRNEPLILTRCYSCEMPRVL